MVRVFVSIGSNIERERNIRSGVADLRRAFGPLDLSRVYESAAVGFAGENFYNLVVAFDTDRPPEAVVAGLDRIEDAHGRKRSGGRFSDRTLDLDILLYGDLIRRDAVLRVPRREITEYAFVLRPLAEIAGESRHPESGRRFADLRAGFDQNSQPLWPVPLGL